MPLRSIPAEEPGEQQLRLFASLEDLDAHARLVLSKVAEVESAQEARIGREDELHATPKYKALVAAEEREAELREELRILKADLEAGVLNRQRSPVDASR